MTNNIENTTNDQITEIDEEFDYDDTDLSDSYDGYEAYDERSYGPSNPWDAPGMSISDFCDFPVCPF